MYALLKFWSPLKLVAETLVSGNLVYNNFKHNLSFKHNLYVLLLPNRIIIKSKDRYPFAKFTQHFL